MDDDSAHVNEVAQGSTAADDDQTAAPAVDQEQETYLREGGTLDLFPNQYPTDVGAGVMWTQIKRQAMARAMRDHGARGGLISVSRIPIEGAPHHFHPGESDHFEPHQSRASEMLGPLGYSLLRGQISILDHLYLRLQILGDAYEDLIAGVIGARADGIERPDQIYKERSRLIFWDILGLLLQVSEQAAAIFISLQQWTGKGQDLGELMIRSEVQPWRVIQSLPFGSEKNWKRILGIPASAQGRAALSSDQRTLLSLIHEKSLAVLMSNVTDLRQIWTEDLHRVATRYKHSYPILNVGYGSVWLGSQEAEARRLIDGGALVILDTKRGGQIEELVVPVTIGGIEILFGAVVAALRVGSILVDATLQGAEHPSGRVLVVHPYLREAGVVTTADSLALTQAYARSSGLVDEVLPGLVHQAGVEKDIYQAAMKLRGYIPSGYWHRFAESPEDTELPPTQ